MGPYVATTTGSTSGSSGGRGGRWPWTRLLRWLGGGFLGALVLLLVWGLAIEPRLILDVEQEVAPVPDLPMSWQGREVAVLADFQVGLWWDNDGMVRRAVDTAIERQPDLALLIGDFIYNESNTEDNVAIAVDAVAPLVRAGIPTYAVLGNHDYDAEAAELLEASLEDVGITVLHNEAVAIPAPGGGEPLHLVGVAPLLPGLAEPAEAVAEVPGGAPRLVMLHNPDTFPQLPPGTAPITVAGHTHGGQMRLPFLPRWSYLALFQEGEVQVDGWIDESYGQPGNRLYVNRGIGMSLVPLRINAPPELTILELQPAT